MMLSKDARNEYFYYSTSTVHTVLLSLKLEGKPTQRAKFMRQAAKVIIPIKMSESFN